jgi:SAM-dependent methyltransferase
MFNMNYLEDYYEDMYVRRGDGTCKYETDLVWYLPNIMATWLKQESIIDTSVAEIGIGNGLLSKAYFGNEEPTWDGYDLSYRACRESEGLYKYIQKHDINKSPLPHKYDCILACGVFSWYHLDHTCIENIYNSLNTDGILIASIPKGRGYWKESGLDRQIHFDVVMETHTFQSGKFEQLSSKKEWQHHQIKVLKRKNNK